MVSVTHYATNVHGQPNANASHAKYRVGWANIGFATSKTGEDVPKGVTQSFYYKENKYRKPVTFTAHDFNFNIPDCAYITNVAFTVRIRCSGTKLKVKAPLARFNIYNGREYVSTYREDDTGWEDGYYYVNPNKRLTNSWQDITYTMDKTQFHNRDYPVSSLNDIIMGIDLRWYNASTLADSTIYIEWVRCTVDYEMPNPVLTFDKATSENEPRFVKAGEKYILEATFSNRSNAGCCGGTTKQITVDLPPNAEALCLNGSFDESTNIWTVPCTPNSTSKLQLEITDYSVGEYSFLFKSEYWNLPYWVYNAPSNHDVGEIRAFPNTIQQEVMSCIGYHATVLSNDGEVTVRTNVDTANSTAPDLIWSIDYDYTSPDVTIESSTNDSITFNVPVNERRTIVFRSCFIPTFSGYSAVRATLVRTPDEDTYHVARYTSIPAPRFVVKNKTDNDETDRKVSEILFNPSVINLKTNRVASSTELGAYIIDCGIAEYDGNMIIDDCTLTASTWEKLDYIGMVPLKYHHYDPKATYENKAISKNYKNKSYKGKEGVIDEDISLQFKVRPPEATTLEGLVKLDKPTPINANHKCFEGDTLNHRGWVVLSKVEIERTNPLWYDVKATVDYITHDINTKFQIFRGSRVNNLLMPELQDDVFELGASLSSGLDIFKIDTDGGYVYDDSEDAGKNLFSLDEGQHLAISTINPLTNISKLRFDWYSNRVDEIRENEMTRIFRLRDKEGNPVFEYEYTNFQFDGDYVSCSLVLRSANKDGGWNEPRIEEIELKTEIDADPIADDDSDEEDFTETIIDIEDIEVTDEELSDDDDDEINTPAYEQGYVAPSFDPSEYDVSMVYGSSLELELNGNILRISDAGFNGREFTDTFELPDSNYYFETFWRNNNADGMTEDIISYIDIGLSETVLETQYNELYSNMIVSPFPIPYRKVMFTRESEEGTIYYITGEEPFKYRLEPFYQYHCGTDLVTRDGISIFDLNNSYTYFYIENGLVRMGFNKFNGRLYLAKWDIQSKDWVTTHFFQMDNNTKFSIASYSDDKIVVKAGTDTLFTIWRGHPYVMIQNPTDTIDITSNFNYGLGDNIDGKVYIYPVVHSFLNTNNLLPPCIGGTSLNYKCIEIDDDQITPGTDHEISLNIPTLTALEDNTIGVSISPSTSDGEVHYLVDGVDIGGAESPFSLTTDAFKEAKSYDVQAVYTGDEDDKIAISEKVTVIVEPPEPDPDTEADKGTPAAPTGEYRLAIVSAPSYFLYDDRAKVVLQLTRGGVPVEGMIVEAQLPNGHTESFHTDVYGQVYIENRGYLPGNYQWGGRFYDDWNEQGGITGKLMYTALKWIEIRKYTPYFKTNSDIGRVSKGKDFIVKIKGHNENLDGVKLTYTINGGGKKTKTTNAKGNIHIPCNTIGIYTIKVSFAGNKMYNGIVEKFVIVVI